MSRAAAYINSMATCAQIEMESMKAANRERENQGLTLAYGEKDFMGLIEKWGIHHNAVVTHLNEERSHG